MKAPAFQFYAQDFLTGVMFLTNEEKGIYITLLAKQWTDGKLPLKRIEFLIQKKWEFLSEELKNKFKTDGNFIWNERLEVERKKQKEKSQKAKESAERRWKKNDKKASETLKKSNEKNAMRSHKKRISESDAFLEVEDRSMKHEDEVEKEKEKGGVGEKTNDFEKVKYVFNEKLPMLPQVQKLNKHRIASINARIKEYKPDNVEVFFSAIFEKVSQSEFLTGNNDRGWQADFDWILKPTNFLKIIENKYQQNGNRNKTKSRTDAELKRDASNAVDKFFGQK